MNSCHVAAIYARLHHIRFATTEARLYGCKKESEFDPKSASRMIYSYHNQELADTTTWGSNFHALCNTLPIETCLVFMEPGVRHFRVQLRCCAYNTHVFSSTTLSEYKKIIAEMDRVTGAIVSWTYEHKRYWTMAPPLKIHTVRYCVSGIDDMPEWQQRLCLKAWTEAIRHVV